MDPADLQSMLAYMQATQDTVRFPVEYPNHAKGRPLNKNVATTEARAIELFQQVRPFRPDYRVQNLATRLLVERVLRELEPQIDKDTITLTNGCCTMPHCPTTKFIECVVRALENP